MKNSITLPETMAESEYNQHLEDCLDFNGNEVSSIRYSLDHMISLAIEVDALSAENFFVEELLEYSDVSLQLNNWNGEFVCESGVIAVKCSKQKDLYVVYCMGHSQIFELGLYTTTQIFEILRGQRALESNPQ